MAVTTASDYLRKQQEQQQQMIQQKQQAMQQRQQAQHGEDRDQKNARGHPRRKCFFSHASFSLNSRV